MKKRTLLLCVALVMSLALAAGSTLAYLSDTDADVNTMTLGNVKIEQLEYERVVDQNGAWIPTGEEDKYGYTPDKIQPFTQDKPLFPTVLADGVVKYDDRANDHQQSWDDVEGKKTTGAPGSCYLFDDSMKGVVDKFVFVENTGKSPAYVRTWFAFEQGSLSDEEFEKLIITNGDSSHWKWETVATGYEITGEDGTSSKYVICHATYLGPKADPTGLLQPGTITYPSLLQVYLDPTATNKDVAAVDGNGNGTYDILVLSQAIQAAGFSNADEALKEGFGEDVPKFPTEIPEEAPEKIWENVVPDKKVDADAITDGELKLEDGSVIEIEDLDKPIRIEGNGTVIIEDAGIATPEEGTPGILIPEGSQVTIIVKGDSTVTGGSGADGITVEKGAEVVITGPGKLTVVGGGGPDVELKPDGTTNFTAPGGDGIGGSGDIVIRDLEDLDATGYGSNASGIGGNANSITIENSTISNAQGGYFTITWKPTNYGKGDPEGGPAIGSTHNNAVITLTGDTIVSAKGGSKAAGIGTSFWNSATINITDCVIEEVLGGGYGAGIGASRVHQRVAGDSRQYVTITITDTTVKMAQGGLYGSGIGSAYDTHTQTPDQSIMTTIYIKGNSDITAYGGERAAGIGTGYHCGALAGEIEDSVKVEAKAGGDPYKYGTYTPAQDVGFGILDPTRSGKNNTSVFYYHGVAITQPDPMPPLNQN